MTEDPSRDAARPDRSLTTGQKISYAMGETGVSLTPAIVTSWLVYFYTGGADPSAAAIGIGAVGVANFLGRWGEVFANPPIGYLSDRLTTRWGRRIPWIALGSPVLTIAFILMWFPPFRAGGPGNQVFLTIVLGFYWVAYVAVCAPYLSLLPEITPLSDERLSTSVYMGVFDIVGYVLATVAVGWMIGRFRGGVEVAGLHLADGFKLVGIVMGALSLLVFGTTVLRVREKPHAPSKDVPFRFSRAFAQCLRNPAFPPYVLSVALFRVGIDTVVAVIPFLVGRVTGYDEAVAGYLQGGIILIAAALFPLVEKASARYGKKSVYLAGMAGFTLVLPLVYTTGSHPVVGSLLLGLAGKLEGAPPGLVRMVHLCSIFVLCSFFISIFFVLPRPIFADVIDHDEKLTGYRREAMYNGMEGLIHKFAAAFTPLVYSQVMMRFGDTAENPMGILLAFPVAGVFLLLGTVAFVRYPFRR